MEHLCSIILPSFHKGINLLVSDMSVQVTRGCILALVGSLAEAWGWSGRSADGRHAGTVWISQEGWRSSLVGVLEPLASSFATMHACLTPTLLKGS